MKGDIEQRAEEYAVKLGYFKPSTPVVRESYIAGATEERERGKRFNHWACINNYRYTWEFKLWGHGHDYENFFTYEQLFEKFLSEEK